MKAGIYIKAFFLFSILLAMVFTGCIREKQQNEPKISSVTKTQADLPSVLPDWDDGNYHDYYATIQKLTDFDNKYPNTVHIFTIGSSVLGRDIWCIRITNENNGSKKFSCLLDGCIHGNEWEGGEACLYLAEYLLINFGRNATVNRILNTTEVYIVPLVNPDGRQKDERWNDNGVDLNRNFDVDFGKLIVGNVRLGKLFGIIKIPIIKLPFIGTFKNCGKRPFSEPETQALRNLMETLNSDGFSFYVNCHTAQHCLFGPYIIDSKRPAYKISQKENDVISYVLNWVAKNSEYEGRTFKSKKSMGIATDWCFKEFRIPSFTFELLSKDYDPYYGKGKHDNLVHWMDTTLPVFLYLLANAENLHDWKIPDNQPSLPKGVPPSSSK